jgi:AI-2 transport protein TqsA
MNKTSEQPKGLQILLAVAAFVIVVAGMRAAEAILVPFLLSAFIAVIFAPLLIWMQGKGVPTPLAILLVVMGVAVAGLLLIGLVGSSVKDFSNNLDTYQAQLKEDFSGVLTWLEETTGLGDQAGPVESKTDVATGPGAQAGPDENEREVPGSALSAYLTPSSAMRFFGMMVSGLGSAFSNAFLILIIVVFILLEASSLPTKLHAMAGGETTLPDSVQKIVTEIRRYMVLKTVISLMTGLVVGLWLAALGVKYAVMWGLLAFLLNFVPNIGSIIAAVPAVLMAFIQLGGERALAAAAGYLVVNVVVGSLIEPRVMGKGLGLSPLIVFASLIFWGWVLGPVGMLLSVPLTMAVKIALDSSDETRRLGILLGSGASAKAAARLPKETLQHSGGES